MFDVVNGALAPSPIRLRQYAWLVAGFWTVAIAIVLLWEISDERQQALDIARSEALGAWKKEVSFYRWAANTGRIYVPVNEKTPPDANLSYLMDRDISTPSGHALTVISPPMIMSQVHALPGEYSALQGHITSLKPIRPQDSPDLWEKEAFEAFDKGRHEVESEETIGGQRYFRFMRPMVIEKSCLTCHAEQGYKVGDIHGGLSIAVPMASIWGEQMPDVIHRIAGYGGMWLLGLIGITLMVRRLGQQVSHRYEAERRLQEAHDLLEQRVAERTAELATANQNLENEVVERKQAEQWLLESEERFRSYFEQGLVGMAILSAKQEWLEVNQRLCKMLGYTEDELILKTWSELTHREDWSAAELQFQRLVSGSARTFVIDTRLMAKNGDSLPVGLSVQCMRRPDGTVDCLVVSVQESHTRGQA
jgi:PAS domain S-box-containing protein